MARTKSVNFDMIENLANAAAGGDSSALSELGRLNSQLGRRANQRMRELEKQGLSGTAAYNRAAEALGKEKPRFSQAKAGDAENLLRSLEETTKFLNYQTSTVTGEMLRRQNVLEGLENAGYSVGNNKKAFLDFLDSGAWTEVKGLFGSKDAMRLISDAMERGANIADLTRAFTEFQKGESEAEDILQVWDGWYSEDDQS